MAIIELIEQGLTEEQALEVAEKQLGMPRNYAEFVLSVERGEVDGDIVEIVTNK